MSRLQTGDALGASYRLLNPIGSGAAGEVWAAEPVIGGEVVAAKILKAEHANDPAIVERFVRERSVLLGLRHPSIVDVRDLVVEGTTLAIVMEFVPGGSLRELLAVHGPLPAADTLRLCSEVLQALAIAHGRRVTHRDIKPDNVLLARSWEPGLRDAVRVTDFGVASVVSERQRQTTGLLGTPQYMAPELISHGQTTPTADVYSAGVMLYELLAGRTPFAGPGTDFTVAYRHVTSKPPRLDLPAPLWETLDRMLAKDPRERPEAADAAAGLLRLATRFQDLPALHAQPDAEAFDEIERPATMLRSALMPEAAATSDYISPLSAEVPELCEAEERTVLRPMPRREPPTLLVRSSNAGTAARSVWFAKKSILLAAAGLVSLAGLGIGLAVAFGNKPAEAKEVAAETIRAVQQDRPLPTGLTVSRVAEFDPAKRRIILTVTYAAQRAPLSGTFLEAVPAVETGTRCPVVSWSGVSATRHRASATGIEAACGWALEAVDVPANGQEVVTATIPATVTDESELNTWLARVAETTAEALNDPEVKSTAYPVQRLRDIEVSLPPRVVSQTPIDVTLIPTWPSGADRLNPLFRSPSTGSPSEMLREIAGSDGVRLSDGCAGAVAISSDGLTVTALSVASDCRIRAAVGNFTDLESSPFSITTRE